MSSGPKVRSSSASGRLETQHVTSFLTGRAAPGKKTKNQHVSGSKSEKAGGYCSASCRQGDSLEEEEPPDWLVRELLKHNRRRHSVTIGDKTPTRRRLQHHHVGSAQSLKIDEKISLESLQKLKREFEEVEKAGLRSIDAKKFESIVKKCLGLHKTSNANIQGLFQRIDYSGQGRISWDQFCTHLVQENKVREEAARRNKQVAFTLPATITALNSSFPIISIQPCYDGTTVTLQEDGFVCIWSRELKPQRKKHIFNDGPANRKSRWVSDLVLMAEYDMLMIGTGDREIQMYMFPTLDPYCQINALDTIPLRLNYGYIGPDECCILYGDAEGCVTILLLSTVDETLRLWNNSPKMENMPNITMDSAVLSPNVIFIRWKVHHDWVTQVKYFHSFKAVVSSSNEEASSLVIGCALPTTDAQQQLNEIREACYEGKIKKLQLSWTPKVRPDQTVFSVYKGVKTFDLCPKRSILLTGGVDKLIRLWNPYYSRKSTGILKGHSASISFLCISPEGNHVFSVSIDQTAKIWHIEEQSCLFTVDLKENGIHGDVSACSFSSSWKSLYVAADSMAVLSMKTSPQLPSRLAVSHDDPVTCCGFSDELRQVVSYAEGSVVKVWDFDSGRQVFEFGGKDLAGTTCLTFDPKGRRLITGGKDGCLKIWNFNTGLCLKTLKKDTKCKFLSLSDSEIVCDCIFVKVRRNFYIISVGTDRRINIHLDLPEELHHYQKPEPPWKDDLKNGHHGDILSVAHCPPSLLATGTCNGEIIVWNMVSGLVHCRFGSTLSAEHQNVEGKHLDVSVPSVLFLKNSSLCQFPSNTVLLSSGAKGCINLWSVLDGGKFVSSFRASKEQQKVVKLAKANSDALLYVGDQIGYIYVYSTETFAFEHKMPRAAKMWRAHTGRITGLHIIDSDQVVLTSSTDCTVRLWSARGQFIGTFGQPEIWSVDIPSSWIHPDVPFRVLIDPRSFPDEKMLSRKSHLSKATS
ncbi:WD repeat-containing protein on Y chromosome [Gouania willdenowi]|uniref:WD repeat-containing protein on Y chromosome n=1 Tax=Gouania willdenowi TaxID=441366 RepID=UPI001056470D|nr:WD repeat-containing protein on Y chromosome-like [Gouania willdenowi]